MSYRTMCQRGLHEYDLGLNVETKKHCIYCGQHKFIAAIKSFLGLVG